MTSLELEPGIAAAGSLRELHALHRGLSDSSNGALGRRLELDARRCISYLTIELRGPIPEELHAGMGDHVFGCDICQDVCPWNSRAPVTEDPDFAGIAHSARTTLAQLSPEEFRERFKESPIARAKYSGLMRTSPHRTGA